MIPKLCIFYYDYHREESYQRDSQDCTRNLSGYIEAGCNKCSGDNLSCRNYAQSPLEEELKKVLISNEFFE